MSVCLSPVTLKRKILVQAFGNQKGGRDPTVQTSVVSEVSDSAFLLRHLKKRNWGMSRIACQNLSAPLVCPQVENGGGGPEDIRHRHRPAAAWRISSERPYRAMPSNGCRHKRESSQARNRSPSSRGFETGPRGPDGHFSGP